MTQSVTLTINGEPYTLLVEPYCSLLDMLRDRAAVDRDQKRLR